MFGDDALFVLGGGGSYLFHLQIVVPVRLSALRRAYLESVATVRVGNQRNRRRPVLPAVDPGKYPAIRPEKRYACVDTLLLDYDAEILACIESDVIRMGFAT